MYCGIMLKKPQMEGKILNEENLLIVRNVWKKVNGRDILKDISLSIKSGEIVGILGPNGSGKTTLLKLIAHLLIVDRGDVIFKEFDMIREYDKALEKIGIVLGNGMLYDDLTGWKNLSMRARVCNKYSKEKLDAISRIFHVKEYLNRKCREYSLGMRQRLALTMACVSQPELLVLDEPMNGLDPEGMRQLSQELRQMAKENNVAVLISSHLLYDVESLCDKVVFIKDGELIGEEKITDIQGKGKKLSDFYFEIMGEVCE